MRLDARADVYGVDTVCAPPQLELGDLRPCEGYVAEHQGYVHEDA